MDKTADRSPLGRLRLGRLRLGRLRQSIETNNLASIFNSVREQLKQKLNQGGLIREIFTLVDSSQLVSKIHLWSERDKAIAEGLEKFNNRFLAENKSKNINK